MKSTAIARIAVGRRAMIDPMTSRGREDELGAAVVGEGYLDPLIRAADRLNEDVLELFRELFALERALGQGVDPDQERRRAEVLREISELRAYSNYFRLQAAHDAACLRGERPLPRFVRIG
jgi:hypothetical protein